MIYSFLSLVAFSSANTFGNEISSNTPYTIAKCSHPSGVLYSGPKPKTLIVKVRVDSNGKSFMWYGEESDARLVFMMSQPDYNESRILPDIDLTNIDITSTYPLNVDRNYVHLSRNTDYHQTVALVMEYKVRSINPTRGDGTVTLSWTPKASPSGDEAAVVYNKCEFSNLTLLP